MQRTRTILLSLLLALALLVTQACSPASTVILSLDALDAAVAAALPILSTAGLISPGDLSLYETKLAAITEAVSEAATELSSSDTPTQKSEKIATYFAGTVLPTLGLSPTVSAIMQAVNAAVQAFLSQMQLANSPALVSHPGIASIGFTAKLKLQSIKRTADRQHRQILALQP